MKSVFRYGTIGWPSAVVNVPRPSPVPPKPPFAIEYSDFTSWKLSQSWRSASLPLSGQDTGCVVHGWSQIVTRSRTCAIGL